MGEHVGVMKREFMEVLTFGRSFEDVREPWMQEDWGHGHSSAQCSLPECNTGKGPTAETVWREPEVS